MLAKLLVLLNGNFLKSANLSNQITLPFHLLGITHVRPNVRRGSSRLFANCNSFLTKKTVDSVDAVHHDLFDLCHYSICTSLLRFMMKSIYPDPEHKHRPEETNVLKLSFLVEALCSGRNASNKKIYETSSCSAIGCRFAGVLQGTPIYMRCHRQPTNNSGSLEYVHVGVTGVTCSSSFFFLSNSTCFQSSTRVMPTGWS